MLVENIHFVFTVTFVLLDFITSKGCDKDVVQMIF